MTLSYQSAEEADVTAVYEQAKELIDRYEDISTIDYEKVLAWVKRKIASHICDYTSVLLDGEVCAYYHLCADGELDDVYVLPSFRGRGIGSQILAKCIDESSNPLYLYVFSRNTQAIRFYKRFGFVITETVSDTRHIMSRRG